MTGSRAPRLLILETSTQAGQVALAEGGSLLGVRRLDEARRHARDLAPAVRDLLGGHGWRPRDLDAVIVGRGPGSYTGLRVGIMSAKALAYATGCVLLAVDSFAAIARQAPPEALNLHVVADAQQNKVYLQGFRRDGLGGEWAAASALAIEPVAECFPRLAEGAWVTGPGLHRHQAQLPASVHAVAPEQREPRPESLLQIGLARYLRGERDDAWAMEPLYLRPSSAEEQWDRRR